MTTDRDVSACLRAMGARATPARTRVLTLLLRSPRALSHGDIEEELGEFAMDRVTLYRVLDWLVAKGLAHRTTDEARVFRFSAADETHSTHFLHAHFRCDSCGRVFCLEHAHIAKPRLPDGFVGRQVDLNVRGYCAECAHPS